MLKLAVFDLDNTLAEIGKGITPENVGLLRQLEERGVRIAICSGKPTYYLCGFMRQIGLREPILVGENGAVIQFGVDLPPHRYEILPHSQEAKQTIRFLKERFDEILPQMWYQPNQVALTPFPARAEEFGMIEACIEEHSAQVRDVTIYRHVDTFDIVPNGISKFDGIKRLGELLSIPAEETAAIGDGVNDYPMFDYAGIRVGVNIAQAERVDHNFSCPGDALRYLHSCAM